MTDDDCARREIDSYKKHDRCVIIRLVKKPFQGWQFLLKSDYTPDKVCGFGIMRSTAARRGAASSL